MNEMNEPIGETRCPEPAAGTAATLYPDDPALREQVLRPYRDQATYLKSADVHMSAEGVALRGTFGVEESWYIDDTGHFNAVEFNICYNQALYYLIAKCVQENLLEAFSSWKMADFWQRQLPNVLITHYSSRFRRALRPRKFEGELRFLEPSLRERPGKPPLLVIETAIRFWDDEGDKCEGQVTVALTDLPQP